RRSFHSPSLILFLLTDPSTTAIYTLSLHDALPILLRRLVVLLDRLGDRAGAVATYEAFAKRLAADLEVEPAAETKALLTAVQARDRKSTRLNSSHVAISYAVFCLKKKNNNQYNTPL